MNIRLGRAATVFAVINLLILMVLVACSKLDIVPQLTRVDKDQDYAMPTEAVIYYFTLEDRHAIERVCKTTGAHGCILPFGSSAHAIYIHSGGRPEATEAVALHELEHFIYGPAHYD